MGRTFVLGLRTNKKPLKPFKNLKKTFVKKPRFPAYGGLRSVERSSRLM